MPHEVLLAAVCHPKYRHAGGGMAAPAGYGRDVRRDVDVVLEVAAAGPSLVHGALLVLLLARCDAPRDAAAA